MLRNQKCQDNLRVQSEEHFFPLEEKNWKKTFTGYSKRELKVRIGDIPDNTNELYSIHLFRA